MSQFDFRLRFHLPDGDHINADVEELPISSQGDARIRLRSGGRGTTIKACSRPAMIGGPYETIEEARAAAERAKRALLVWAVRNRMGIDLGGRQPRGAITDEGRRRFAEMLNHQVRTDVHGIDVYEHTGGLLFFGIEAQGAVERQRTPSSNRWPHF